MIKGKGISARNAKVRSTLWTSYRSISMTARTIDTRYTATNVTSTSRIGINTFKLTGKELSMFCIATPLTLKFQHHLNLLIPLHDSSYDQRITESKVETISTKIFVPERSILLRIASLPIEDKHTTCKRRFQEFTWWKFFTLTCVRAVHFNI